MDGPTREKKLRELRDELMHERGVAAMGGAPPNPGKIRALRKNIARMHTIQSQEGPAAPAPSAPTAAGKPASEPAKKAEEPQDELEDDVEEEKP